MKFRFYLSCLAIVFVTLSLTKVYSQVFNSSNLPIVIVNTDIDPNTGQPIEIPDEPKVLATMKIIFRPDGSRNYMSDQNNPAYLNYDGRIGIEIRGSTSQYLPKKPYGLTTLQSDNVSNNNVELLGMPSENDWILNSFAFDASLMRDVISYKLARDIGNYAVKTVYCELVVNGDYKGLYILSEKIKIDGDRLNLVKLTTNDNILPELSGGYITKADKTTGGDPIAWSMPSYAGEDGWVHYIHENPKPENITTAQHNYIKNHFTAFQQAMTNQNSSLVDGFPSMIDIPSFIDFMLINELASNVDAYQYSTFFHKDREGKLRAGPVWDLNLTYGNDLFFWGFNRSHTNVWQFNYDGNRGSKFWKDLFDQAQFKCYLTRRWKELNAAGQPLSYNEIKNMIDTNVEWIAEATIRENQRWETIGNHAYHIAELKTWLQERIFWLNTNLNNFQACANPFVPNLVISKIHYHPKSDQGFSKDDLEFIEITNHSDATVDLTGIYIQVPGISFGFPPYSAATAGQKIYLASNASVFEQYYGFAPFGQYSRNLSNKSYQIRLSDAWGNVIDELQYWDSNPWPSQADGDGPYLQLIDLDLDNSLPQSWTTSDNQLVAIPESHSTEIDVFQIVPQPAKGSAKIISNILFTKVKIYDLQGAMLAHQQSFPTKTFDLDISKLKPGIYQVILFDENKTARYSKMVVL